MDIKLTINRLLFYWISSFILAILLYYILWFVMPKHFVFGALYRMFVYHWAHPIQFIAIPCFFYGIIAALLANKFQNKKTSGRIILTLLIIVLTILISSPFGGMLWHYHDMKAGYFPVNWISIMISRGFKWGLEVGWLVIGLSIPYNIIGSIICYFLTKKGIELFENDKIKISNTRPISPDKHPST